MRCVLIASQKGGVGKTTTAINLAALCATSTSRVLLVDSDPLGGVLAALGLEPDQGVSAQTLNMNCPGEFFLEVLPGLDVFSLDTSMVTPIVDQITIALNKLQLLERYQLVIVDSSPLKDATSQMLLSSCDELLVTLRAEPLALRSLPDFLESIHSELHKRPTFRFHGFLLTLPPCADEISSEVEILKHALGNHLLPTVIPFDDEVDSAVLLSTPVTKAYPTAAVSSAYSQVAHQLQLLNFVPVETSGVVENRISTILAQIPSEPALENPQTVLSPVNTIHILPESPITFSFWSVCLLVSITIGSVLGMISAIMNR